MLINRQTIREIQHLPRKEFENVVNQVIRDETERARAFYFNLACTSMFTALINRYPWMENGDILHSIAVDTVDIANGIEPASELRALLLERTGFDVYEKPHESALNYIEKGEGIHEQAG